MDASTRGEIAPARRPPAPLALNLAGIKVALVHDWLTGMRGGEKCLEVLCRAFPDATLHTLIHSPGALSPAIERMAIRPSPLQRIPGVRKHYRHLLPAMPWASRSWDVGDADLVISLSHCVAKMVRVPEGVPHVCYCFTPMRYAWDGRDAYLASWSDRPVRLRLASAILNRLRRLDRATSSRVSHFVAISRTIEDRIKRCYDRASRVIQPPVDVDFYVPAASNSPREDFYLCVSALVPYKRIDQAIAAAAALGRRLIVIGSGPERARLEALAGSTVTFLGWQSDEVIRDHYQRARSLLFPGEEDFGIVPVEALACGCPVVALGRGGVAETVDDQVGRVYTEPSATALRDAIEAWERAGCPHDSDLARTRAEGLSLPVFRRRLLGYLAEVMAERETATSAHTNAIPAPHVFAGAPPIPDRERERDRSGVEP